MDSEARGRQSRADADAARWTRRCYAVLAASLVVLPALAAAGWQQVERARALQLKPDMPEQMQVLVELSPLGLVGAVCASVFWIFCMTGKRREPMGTWVSAAIFALAAAGLLYCLIVPWRYVSCLLE